MLLVPVSLAIAILRHQLYDIDLLINRTLVYGSLTAILFAIYFLGVVGVQALIEAVTGIRQESPLAIVASTLLTPALFQPLRRRLQQGIDCRSIVAAIMPPARWNDWRRPSGRRSTCRRSPTNCCMW